jgi:hypothetical protein
MQGPEYNLKYNQKKPSKQKQKQTKTCRATTKAVEVGGKQFEAHLGKEH